MPFLSESIAEVRLLKTPTYSHEAPRYPLSYISKQIDHQSLVSRMRSDEPSRPMQAFKNASRPFLCLLRLLTTSVPKGRVE